MSVNISGTSGWFSSCVGTDYGACGTCRKTKYQCAYQHLSGYSGCYCSCPPELACGDCVFVLGVTSGCEYYGHDLTIADHGPGACSGCGNDCLGYCGRIICMTPTAFAYYNNLAKGVITVSIYSPC
jgi:hypothetical protein